VDEFIRLTIFGLVAAAIYFVAASGLVLTYTTSGIFNFAHGAIGMVAAFVYWELRFNPDGPVLPTPLALLLVLGVFAPLFGVLVERVLIRNLQGASLATTLVVTVGMLAALIGLAQTFWPPESRVVRGFFDPDDVKILGVNVTWHRIITVLIAVGVAVGLRVLLYRTRIGVAMRAVVDNRTLAGLNGAQAHRVSALSWAIGSSLAALGGILLAPALGLEIIALTLLVVNAYAAAMVGRLRSLPLTVVGAVILGLLVQYVPNYLPKVFADDTLPDWLTGINNSLPILMLFVVLLLLPEERLGGWQARAARRIRVPSLAQSLLGGAALVAAAVVVSGFLSDRNLGRVGQGLALGVIVLSLVPLTGYAGQISLAQMTLAGVGAFVMAKVAAEGSPIGLLAATLIAGAVGGIIALPALRLRGLYLALSTLAIAVLADNMFFPQRRVFFTGSLEVSRLDLGFIDFDSDRSYFVLLAVAYALVAVFVLTLRRGQFGRRLLAMKDSPAACATLGLNLTRTKFTVFAVSAALGERRRLRDGAGPAHPAPGRARRHRHCERGARGRPVLRAHHDHLAGVRVVRLARAGRAGARRHHAGPQPRWRRARPRRPVAPAAGAAPERARPGRRGAAQAARRPRHPRCRRGVRRTARTRAGAGPRRPFGDGGGDPGWRCWRLRKWASRSGGCGPSIRSTSPSSRPA
jgi:branched-chain amino acid transport system permease protein